MIGTTPNVTGDFKSFVISNNIATTMAGVTVAFSTGIFIRSLVGDIILPSIYGLFVNKLNINPSGAFAPLSKLNVDIFIKEFVSWIFVIIFTFIIVEYVIRRWMLKTPSAPVPATTPAHKKDDTSGGSVSGGEDGGTEHFYYY